MDEPTPASRPRMRWFLIVGLGLFALLPPYIASVGPACRLRVIGWLNQSVIATVYAPLIVLEQRAPALFKPIEHYAMWWSKLAGEESPVPSVPSPP